MTVSVAVTVAIGGYGAGISDMRDRARRVGVAMGDRRGRFDAGGFIWHHFRRPPVRRTEGRISVDVGE